MKVAQKIILGNSDGLILALRRAGDDYNRPLTWDFPGGGLNEGEDLRDGLHREIREEIGDEIKVSEIIIHDALSGFNDRGEYSVLICYLGKIESGAIKLSHEHDEFKWVTADEFLKLESSKKIELLIQKLKMH